MQLLYINELEKKKALDDFYLKQRRGIKALPNDETLTEVQIKAVMDKVLLTAQFSQQPVKQKNRK